MLGIKVPGIIVYLSSRIPRTLKRDGRAGPDCAAFKLLTFSIEKWNTFRKMAFKGQHNPVIFRDLFLNNAEKSSLPKTVLNKNC